VGVEREKIVRFYTKQHS